MGSWRGQARGARIVAIASALAILVVAAPATAKPKPPKPPKPPAAAYAVGISQRSISPDADGTYADKPVYLGGYGIGGSTPISEGRSATGILGDGPSVRAFAVADRAGHTFPITKINE